MGRRYAGAAPFALVALLAAWLVQVVAGTSPVMVVSDAVFHANNLARVAQGDLFPTSVTQHAQPFRFPYGVSFYALLAPLARGIDTLTLVRLGVAAAGVVASAAVFLVALGHLGPLAALMAAAVFQLLPGAFEVAYSYGNLSNAFGQAADRPLLLLVGRAHGRAGGRWAAPCWPWPRSRISRASCSPCALVLALAVAERRGPEPDRTRLWAAAAGLAAAAFYYAHFTGMIWAQIPRLLEGGGQGRGVSRTAWDALRLQVLGALGQWGSPAIVLAWLGTSPPAHGRRATNALWPLIGSRASPCAVPAVVSPLEVRYLYGLTAAVALSAGAGAARLEAAGGASRLLGRLLCVAQAALGAYAITEAIVIRYRP